MLETFISVALYFGAYQQENRTYFNEQVKFATEDSLNYDLEEIPPSESYIVKFSNKTYIIEVLGQDQNGAGK